MPRLEGKENAVIDAAVARTTAPDSAAAGEAIGRRLRADLQGHSPDALIVFASPRHDIATLLAALRASCEPAVVVGCSSAGEFVTAEQGEGSVSAVALRAPADEMRFAAGIGRGLSADRARAAREVVSAFRGLDASAYRYRSALVLIDALAGYADDLIDELTLATAGAYQFFGGGAGDDAAFRKTHVFRGDEVASDAVVALEILSNKPLGIGVAHGWEPTSPPLRVTESEGMRVLSLNAVAAVEAFEDHAAATGQRFDAADPLPFFLQNVIGLEAADGYQLRVPLAALPGGAITCAADVPTGATARLMGARGGSATDAAARATRSAVRQLGGLTPGVALFFDCVATRLRTGQEFRFELEAVQEALGPARFAGCNTYGQIVRADGQFSGFHNCSAVVCVIPG